MRTIIGSRLLVDNGDKYPPPPHTRYIGQFEKGGKDKYQDEDSGSYVSGGKIYMESTVGQWIHQGPLLLTLNYEGEGLYNYHMNPSVQKWVSTSPEAPYH